MKGRPTQKTNHPNKSTVCTNNFGTICTNCPPFPFKISRTQAKIICANCLCKLFLFGRVLFWVGRLRFIFWGGGGGVEVPILFFWARGFFWSSPLTRETRIQVSCRPPQTSAGHNHGCIFVRVTLTSPQISKAYVPSDTTLLLWTFLCKFFFAMFEGFFRSPGTTPISGKTLSEWEGHSRSSRRVPGYSRSSSRNSKFRSRSTKFHSRNGIPRLQQYENHNSRSNSQSDSRNWWEPTWNIWESAKVSHRRVFALLTPEIRN